MNNIMKRVVILQPSYIPWIGYFDQINKADIFVFYDDVQYTRRDWRNRNRIKLSSGNSSFLTVPVSAKGNYDQPINKIKIDFTQKWQKKHINSLFHNYKNTPFFNDVFPILEESILTNYTLLSDFTIALTKKISRYLEIKNTQFIKSYDTHVSYNDSTNHLVKLCKKLEATHYLSGTSAQDYLDESQFQNSSIVLEYHNYVHPQYPQLWGEFISHLSIVDILFNCGKKSLLILQNKQTKTTIFSL